MYIDTCKDLYNILPTALSGKDFSFTVAKLHFTDINTNSSISDEQVVIPIIDDDIAEPRESFICNLQGDSVNAVQAAFPSQVTIEIIDNDGEDMHVHRPCYSMTEMHYSLNYSSFRAGCALGKGFL